MRASRRASMCCCHHRSRVLRNAGLCSRCVHPLRAMSELTPSPARWQLPKRARWCVFVVDIVICLVFSHGLSSLPLVIRPLAYQPDVAAASVGLMRNAQVHFIPANGVLSVDVAAEWYEPGDADPSPKCLGVAPSSPEVHRRVAGQPELGGRAPVRRRCLVQQNPNHLYFILYYYIRVVSSLSKMGFFSARILALLDVDTSRLCRRSD